MATAIQALEKMRWPIRTRCAYCTSMLTYHAPEDSNQYICGSCHKSFSIITNTIFQRLKITPDQIINFLKIIRDGHAPKPYQIGQKIGVHHWTVKKLLVKMEGHPLLWAIGTTKISFFDIIVEDIIKNGGEEKYRPHLLFMFIYKFITKDESNLHNLIGDSPEFVATTIDRTIACWEEGKEFEDADDSNWTDLSPESWDKNFKENLIHINLHALCIDGILLRDIKTGTYGLVKDK